MKEQFARLQDLSINHQDLVGMIGCTYRVREDRNFQAQANELEKRGFKVIGHSGENKLAYAASKLQVAIFRHQDEENKIYIAFSGSYHKIDFWHSFQVILKDKTFGYVIPKSSELKKFLEEHSSIIGLDTKIVLTGHSFGGLLSQYAALELKSKGFYNLECYNFSPLSTPKIITRLMREHNFNPEKSKYFSGTFALSVDDQQFVNIVRPKDLIFATGDHFGVVHHIPCEKDDNQEIIGCWSAFKIKIIGDVSAHSIDSYLLE